MHAFLKDQNTRPPIYSAYTAAELWTEPHLATQMLTYHLDPDAELASRSREFIRRSVDWLVDRFLPGEGRRVLDLGCGPGLYANPLASSGAQVTGVDFSAYSLQHARKAANEAGLQVDYREADYLEVELEGSFDLILLIFGDFCPLSPSQRARLLSKVSSWLAPGGHFVFDVTSMAHLHSLQEAAGYEWADQGGFWAPGPHAVFNNRFIYEAEEAYLDRYRIIEAHRTRDIFNWIQCYSPASLEAELEANGLGVEEVVGNLAGDRYDPENAFFGVIAGSS